MLGTSLCSFNFIKISFEEGAFKDAPPNFILVFGAIVLVVAIVLGLSLCSSMEKSTDGMQDENTSKTQSALIDDTEDSQSSGQNSFQESFSLYKEEQTSGTIDDVEPSASDFLECIL